MKTVLFDSGQGAKAYEDSVPDFIITDHRALLDIVSCPPLPAFRSSSG